MATGLFNLKQVNQAISQGAWSGYIAPKWVEYLVVAGGGAGNYTGGGGAGGLLTGIVSVTAGSSYTVTVGAGGTGVAGNAGQGTAGVSSVFGSISALGGGLGVTNYTSAGSTNNGGSGGGGPGVNVSSTQNSPNPAGNGVSGQGNAGGVGYYNGSVVVGGGGGGAGTVGLNAVNGGSAGNGGAGIASSISGTVTTYAGGGGGGLALSTATASSGGVGGGGAGGTGNGGGTSGTANTGGGGGSGAYNGSFSVSGSGGSGIVIVRYPGNVQFYTGGAITYANGYIVHTFVASGTLAPTTPTVVTADYQISRSLRFNSADSAYLNRTPASAGNRQIWTISFWVKRTTLSTRQEFLGNADSSALNGLYVEFLSDDTFQIGEYGTSSWNWQFQTYPVYRDPSAWYHIVISVDTTQATNTNRVKIYVNNTQITVFNNTVYPSLNFNCAWNTTQPSSIGRNGAYAGLYGNAYLTEIYNIDGQALTPSSFGATNANTGVWSPKAYTGTYGTNGFYLNFSDNSNTTAATLGKDYSGNGNNWTPNNFSVTAGVGNDSLVDSPTNYGTDYGVGGAVRGNYATMNPLALKGSVTLSNGNLDAYSVYSSDVCYSTIGVSSGKWYWEVTPTTVSANMIGISKDVTPLAEWTTTNGLAYYSANGNKYTNGSGSAYGATFTNGDVIGVALDMDAGTLVFYKNGTSQGTAFSGISGTYFASFQNPGANNQVSFNFGQRAWAYTPPGGFKALCTQNLPAPTIGSSPTTLATKYFNPVLYTGNGSARSITGVGFQPDLVWIKLRDTNSSNGWFDAVRGATKRLVSDTTAAEDTISGVTSFDSDGFSLGTSYNGSSFLYVAWNWRASNATAVSNTSGSVTSTVSANTISGFSVVTWTCPSSGAGYTVGHGLGATPAMIIVKERSATNDWYVWHQSFASTTQGNLRLNTTAAVGTSSLIWNNTAPTSTVFSTYVGTTLAASGTGVAYCFAPVAGYSAFGSYTGNGSTDGPFVFTGMRPAYIMVKRTDTGGANMNWIIWDATRNTTNVVGEEVYANLSDAGTTYTDLDFVSNGFKIRNSTTWYNASGGTYIYMAFASNPFKYSLAR